MEVNILKDEKNELEFMLSNLTIAELLRTYLNKQDDVDLAAWKREHPSKNPILKIRTKSKPAKKALQDAISAVEKDLNKIEADFKKAK